MSEDTAERFIVVTHGDRTIRLDTETGKAWVLEGFRILGDRPHWRLIEDPQR